MAIYTNHLVGSRRFGIGQDEGGDGRFNRGQICVFAKTCTNGTYNVRTDATWSENGYAGHFYLAATAGGQGVTRVYRLTGRYAQTSLVDLQGGNRNSGENCILQTSGNLQNNFGLQVVVSGYYSTVEVVVVYVGCSNLNDNFWMID